MQPKQLLLTWIDAFNKADSEALSEIYHEDAINHQIANEPHTG